MILEEKHIQKGDILWKKGDHVKFAFILGKGEVEFFDCKDEAVEIELGSFVGDINALSTNGKTDSNLRANTDCTLFIIKA